MSWLDWLSDWQSPEDVLREAERLSNARTRNVTFAATQAEWETLEQAGTLAAFVHAAYGGDMAELRIMGPDMQAECRFHEGVAHSLLMLNWAEGQAEDAVALRLRDELQGCARASIMALRDCRQQKSMPAPCVIEQAAQAGDAQCALWYWDGKDASLMEPADADTGSHTAA